MLVPLYITICHVVCINPICSQIICPYLSQTGYYTFFWNWYRSEKVALRTYVVYFLRSHSVASRCTFALTGQGACWVLCTLRWLKAAGLVLLEISMIYLQLLLQQWRMLVPIITIQNKCQVNQYTFPFFIFLLLLFLISPRKGKLLEATVYLNANY